MSANATETRVLLGEGEFTWPRGERVTDRYGACYVEPGGSGVTPENADEMLVDNAVNRMRDQRKRMLDYADAPVGAVGSLVAEIVEARPSYHIGDLFHGFGPPDEPLPAGTEVVLGHGELFREVGWQDGPVDRYVVGLKPVARNRRYKGKRIDDRHFWLDPERLYECHSQTVRLFFVPDGAEAA